jgi:hypothetical protein
MAALVAAAVRAVRSLVFARDACAASRARKDRCSGVISLLIDHPVSVRPPAHKNRITCRVAPLGKCIPTVNVILLMKIAQTAEKKRP